MILISVYFVPFWSIYLIAPQYPEGLSMQIWLYKLSGQVEIINGLNHYIGMRHIKEEMFPEFQFLVYIVGFIIAFGLVVSATGSRKLLLVYIGMFLVGGVVAVADFYKWGYDYGHNLDPHAAIQVPGLSYQPPVIGHKKLLNFDAFSYPDTGAWIVIGAVTLFAFVWFFEYRSSRKHREPVLSRPLKLAFILGMISFTSCKPEAEKIVVGKDVCAECKMTIVDPKFGGEIVTRKGRVYKFDDVHCVAQFLNRRGVELSEIHQTLFVNYNDPDKFVNVGSAEFVISSKIKSPMGGNAIAFPDHQSAEKKSAEYEGSKVTNWSTLYNILVN